MLKKLRKTKKRFNRPLFFAIKQIFITMDIKKHIKEEFKKEEVIDTKMTNLVETYKTKLNETNGRYRPCSHFKDSKSKELCRKISGLRSWLHKDLGMRGIVDDMLKDLKTVSDLTDKYQEPLRILHNTGKYPEIKVVGDTYTHERLIKAGLVLDGEGEYHYVNKLNTNYSDLAELITELLVKGGVVDKLSNKTELGVKNYLESIKGVLSRLVKKYFQPEDLKQFIRNTVGLTVVGDEAEDYAGDVLQKFGMKQLYQGGNGDFIDMLFGTDLIMEYKGRTITCQVKSSERQAINASKSNQYRKVDYFISPQNGIGNGIVVYNRKGDSFRLSDNGKVGK